MRYQGLILVFWVLLPQCALKKEVTRPASLLQTERLDPSLYTVTAYVMGGMPLEKNDRITGQWVDGKGEFLPGSDNGMTRFRYTLAPADRYKNLQFKLAIGAAEATSGAVSFKDCDFTAALGYPSDDFRHMILSYNFFEVVNRGDVGPIETTVDHPVPLVDTATLERAPFASSGPDETAVRCERIPTQLSERTITLSMTTSLTNKVRIEYQGQTVSPMTLSRASYTDLINQDYVFEMPTSTPIADYKVPVTVFSPKGKYAYTVSFNRCLGMTDGRNKNLLISQSHGLYFDEKGALNDGGDVTCCFSDGTCTQMIVGLHDR